MAAQHTEPAQHEPSDEDTSLTDDLEEWAEYKRAQATEEDPSGEQGVLRFLALHPMRAGSPVHDNQLLYANVLYNWLVHEGPLPNILPKSTPPQHSLSYRQLKRRHELEKKKQRKGQQEGRHCQEQPHERMRE